MRAPEEQVGIVCVLYYEDYVGPTLRALDRIRSEIGASRTVLVANGTSALPAILRNDAARNDVDIIEHDNRGAEFGAYQAGIDRLLASGQPGWVIFANDTFSTHGHFGSVHRRRLVSELARDREHPTIVGRVESLNRSFELAGHRSHRWVTTSIFAINSAALHTLEHRVYCPTLESLVDETADPARFFAPDVSPVLRNHVANWLFGSGPYPTWYAASALTSQNAAKMARKARAILQEMHLSALLEAVGAEFVDLKNLSRREKVLSKLEGIAPRSPDRRERNAGPRRE